MNIQAKLVGMMASMLVVLVVLMVAIGTGVINTIIYGLNTELLSLTLAMRIEKIEATVKLLEDSGAIGIATYVQQAQRETLQQFQAETTEQRENFYVIATQEQRILFQSKMPQDPDKDEFLLSNEVIQTMVDQKSGTLSYEHEDVGYFTVYRYFEKWDWLIGASLPKTTMFEQRKDYLVTVGWTSLIVFVGLLLVAFLVGNKLIVTPVGTLSTVAKAIASGNFDQTISIRQRDEIGTLAEAFRTMQTTLQQVTVTATALARISKGEIPDKIEREYQGHFNTMKDNVNELIDTMEQITTVAEQISIGDLSVEICKRSDRDRLMEALETMVEGMKDIARSAEVMSTGNLMVKLTERSAQDTLMQALNAMIQHLRSVVLNVKDTANTIATVSQELSSSSEQLSNGAAQQAASMEESSSSMEEMAANIHQNAENARQTEKIALQSVEYAEEGGQVVAETVVAMQQIAQKIAIIEDIANQTRMLSLNATIEAARAQEHGKAFSVVASEVRQLADTTKKAAEAINQLATSSLDVSEKAGEMLTTLVPSIRKTTELIQEISAASSEQSAGAEQVNRAIQQLDQVTQQNSIIAEETATAAEELANQARQLQHTMAFFSIEESSQQQEPKRGHDSIAPRPGAPKPINMPSERGLEEETVTSPPAKSPPNIRLDDHGDEYDAEFERY